MAAFAGVISKQSPIALIGSCSGNKICCISRPLSCVATVGGERALRLPPLRAVNAGGFEPDLSEEPIDYYRTPGVSEDDFPYGYADGAHTWHEGDDGDSWELCCLSFINFNNSISNFDIYHSRDFKEEFLKVFTESGGPTGFQGAISWLFLPGLVGGMVLNVPGDYLYIYTALFVFAFIGIEMAKPDQPFNFEPKIYNMERKERDKFMQEYNSMDIFEFNEKYKDI